MVRARRQELPRNCWRISIFDPCPPCCPLAPQAVNLGLDVFFGILTFRGTPNRTRVTSSSGLPREAWKKRLGWK